MLDGRMSLRFALFFLGIVVALAVLAAYVVRRAGESFGLDRRARAVALALVVAAIVTPFAMRLAGIAVRDALVGGVATLGFGVGLSLIVAAGFLGPFDLARSLALAIARRRARGRERATEAAPVPRQAPEPEPAFVLAGPLSGTAAASVPADVPAPVAPDEGPRSAPDDSRAPRDDEPPLLSRRSLLTRSYVGLALGTGLGTSLYGITLGRHDYVLEQVPIPLRNLAGALDGYTIAQLSDLHVGVFVGERELAAGLDLVRSARPDLIVLTGDLVDHDPSFAPVLGRFARRLVELGARDGVVAIPGNHDYYAGVDVVIETLRRAGVRVLRNDALTIGDRGGAFALLGVDDVWAARGGQGPGADLDAALRDVPADLPRVLLCHNPEYFPCAAGRVDLQLSGHTHGGQVNFLVRPADLVLDHGYVAGHYVREGSQIYVNRGLGTAGPPARVGAPPEVSRIVLTRA